MLVLVTFLSICTVFVAFLLRFLFALESDIRSHGKRSVRVDRIWTDRAPSLAVAQGSAPKLTLVHTSSRLAPQAPLEASGTRLRAVNHSRAKEA